MRSPGAAWDSIPELPKHAVRLLSEGFTHFTSKVGCCTSVGALLTQDACHPSSLLDSCASWKQVVQAQHSADGETTKLLLQLQDGLTVESVIMHYDTSGSGLSCLITSSFHEWGWAAQCNQTFLATPKGSKQHIVAAGVTDTGRGDSDADSCVTAGGSRATLCVSSEVGCQMGCTFCATGTMGLKVCCGTVPRDGQMIIDGVVKLTADIAIQQGLLIAGRPHIWRDHRAAGACACAVAHSERRLHGHGGEQP